MKLICTIFICLCEFNFTPRILPNGCLIAAFEFERVAQKDLSKITWARLVGINYWEWKTPHFNGHALCVYALRNDDIYVYDILNGSRKLPTKQRDIHSIAKAIRHIDKHMAGHAYNFEFLD